MSTKIMRYLFGFADTEGSPNRRSSSSSLWDFNIIFKYVVENNPVWKTTEDVYHICQFSCTKWCRESNKSPLKSFNRSINYLMDHHNCDRICLCFWNAPHDRSIFKHSGLYDSRITTLDLMKFHGKSKLNGPHNALGDVQMMLKYKNSPEEIINKIGTPKLLIPDPELENEKIACGRVRKSSDSKQQTNEVCDLQAITNNFATLSIKYGKTGKKN